MNMPLMNVPFARVIVVPTLVGVDMSFLDDDHRMFDSGAPNGNVCPTSRNRCRKDEYGSGSENPSHISTPFLTGKIEVRLSLII